MIPDLLTDWHVHSTFSDGRDPLETNVAAAESRGLHTLVCVDHVRRDTTWVPSFVDAVRAVGRGRTLTVFSAVEAKLCDEHGALDVPDDLTGVDFVYVADHQFPLGSRAHKPQEVRAWLRSGALSRTDAVTALVRSTIRALGQARRPVVVAHLFSILPKVGLDDGDVPGDVLDELTESLLRTGARVELDERWKAPSRTIAERLAAAGVPLVASSDAHTSDAIGQYAWLPTVVDALRSKSA